MVVFDTEWSPDAKDDIDNLWDWIFEESKDADTATNFIDALIEYVEQNCKYPRNGSRIAIKNDDDYREIYFHEYTIVYEIVAADTKVIVHEVYNQNRIYIRSYHR